MAQYRKNVYDKASGKEEIFFAGQKTGINGRTPMAVICNERNNFCRTTYHKFAIHKAEFTSTGTEER
jgi:hypothetical protein